MLKITLKSAEGCTYFVFSKAQPVSKMQVSCMAARWCPVSLVCNIKLDKKHSLIRNSPETQTCVFQLELDRPTQNLEPGRTLHSQQNQHRWSSTPDLIEEGRRWRVRIFSTKIKTELKIQISALYSVLAQKCVTCPKWSIYKNKATVAT